MNRRHRLVTRVLCIAGIAALGLGSAARAQTAASGWHYLVEPYAMFPNMKGDIGLGNLPSVSVDEDPSDVFSNLQMGAMLYAEAQNEQWAFSSDFLYMRLGADIPSGNVISSGDAVAEQLGWELAALRRLSPSLELGVAATYNRIDSKVRLTINTRGGPVGRSSELTEDWIDPTIVARLTYPLSGKWLVQARGNIGGFGVGSDLTWQIMADVGYRYSDLMLFTIGYRVIDIDYDHGSGRDRFVYNMTTFGPVLRFGFNF